jgi:hypothetical protein
VDLVASAAERTTAATDAGLALAALLAILLVPKSAPSFGRRVWGAALGALVLASLLGAVAHGVRLDGATRELLWQPLYLALGVMMALFVVGATCAWRGERVGRRVLLPMLGVAVAFYGVTRATGGDFVAFVVYEAAAMVFSLAVFLRLALLGHRAGAGTMAAALAVSLAAGVVQASSLGPVRVFWEFDHNGLFHLIQLVGLALLVRGLRQLLPAVGETG